MDKYKMLLVGNPEHLENLKEKLCETCDCDVAADSQSAAEKLASEWFHLVLIQIQPVSDIGDDDRMKLVRGDWGIPKVILVSQPLDEMSLLVRDALQSLGSRAPAVAMVSEAEGLDRVIDVVAEALKQCTGINHQLQIKPGRHVFYDMAGWITPEGVDPGKWVDELESLFRKLFLGCTGIEIELENRRGRRGEFAVAWVEPRSQSVPTEHPLLVKCGHRGVIEEIRENYQRYFLRITAVRLAGFARTNHFAAIALPAPVEQPQEVRDFVRFYQSSLEAEICEAIDRLFGQVCERWYYQRDLPSGVLNKAIRLFYLTRLGLAEQDKVRKSIRDLIGKACSYGLVIKERGAKISFQFSTAGPRWLYPHPLSVLYEDNGLFDFSPTRIGITHGDLRGTNLCIDARRTIQLDGFENMDWGPLVSDVAGLEALLKFQCVSIMNLWELYVLEKELLRPAKFGEEVDLQRHLPELQKIVKIVNHLRKQWARRLSQSIDMQEYYASLFFFTMREAVSEEMPAGLRVVDEVRRLYALLSAAMICFRLKNWCQFKGWPDEEARRIPLPMRGVR